MRLRLLLTAFALLPNTAFAADTPEVVIDRHIDDAIKDANVTPAAQADDTTLIRRLTLDLVGRIPTGGETDAFVKSGDADKRAKLVDRLIASPGFVRHQAAMFESMLNPEGDRRGGN